MCDPGRRWPPEPPGEPARTTDRTAASIPAHLGPPGTLQHPAGRGPTLLHSDLRADNLLLTPTRVVAVDWPWASVGAAWAGFLVGGCRLPPPPGLPSLRAVQHGQGVVAVEWLRRRTGWP